MKRILKKEKITEPKKFGSVQFGFKNFLHRTDIGSVQFGFSHFKLNRTDICSPLSEEEKILSPLFGIEY